MKEKIKIFISVFCIATMALTAFAGCNSNDETVTDGEKENQKIEQTVAEEKAYDIDYDVVNVGDVSVISDYSGIRIINEVSGEESMIFEEPATTMAFNGEILYFFVSFEDMSVESYFLNDETGEKESSDEEWERCKLYSYSVKDKSTKEIAVTYSAGNMHGLNAVYVDSEYIYYTDIKAEDLGNRTSVIINPMLSLQKMNLKTGEISCILDNVGNTDYAGDGTIVYQSDRCANGYNEFYPTHIYNIEKAESYDLDECASLAYAENGRIYYLTEREDDIEDSYYSVYKVESCSLTGTDKKLVSELEFLPEESDYRIFLDEKDVYFQAWGGNADKDFNYNIKTGELEEIDNSEDAKESEDDEGYVVKETANGYYVELYDSERTTIVFRKGEVKNNK
ncbi:MAG: hypothetical protein IKL09_07350 [Clostridia bacterium]|nr:hypothetical protein [Clostridia bacterium]